MKLKLLVLLLLIGLLFPGWTVAHAQEIQSFGYSVGLVVYDWEELHQSEAQEVEFTGEDDALSCHDDGDGICEIAPIPLGIDFPFFENTYSEVYISTNGLLLFGPQSGDSYVANRAIPTEPMPQNLIAAFWDDLTLVLGTTPSKVYYQTFPNCPIVPTTEPCTIIEFYQVEKLGDIGSSPFDFQIVLYQSGDIRLNYQSLPQTITSCTVGIEDDQGVEGLGLFYNQTGLAPQASYSFTHPGDGYRLKAYPLYEGGFLQYNQVGMPFTLRNTGTYPDTYTLSYNILEGKNESDGWTFEFLSDSGEPISQVTLPATPAGREAQITLRITAPETAVRGNFSRIQVIADSDNVEPVVIVRQAAVAAPFAVTLVDHNAIQMQFVTPHRTFTRNIYSGYSGSALSLIQTEDTNYLQHWEFNGYTAGGQIFKNLVFKRVNAVGNSAPPLFLQDHSGGDPGVKDEEVRMYQAPDGTLGIVFIRNTDNTELREVYFAIISSSGRLIQEIKLEDNASQPNLNFSTPAITASSNSHFYVTWNAYDWNDEELYRGDIHYAIFASDGSQLVPPTSLTNAQYGEVTYNEPSLAPLDNGRVLVFYRYYQRDLYNDLYYLTMDDSEVIGEPHELAQGNYPGRVDLTILEGGFPLVAWTDEDSSTGGMDVWYAILESGGENVFLQPDKMALPDARSPVHLSLATDTLGYGVLAWGEMDNGRLYYALVDANGSVITPAMSFRTADAGSLLRMGTEGVSIAPCPDELIWKQAMPTILR